MNSQSKPDETRHVTQRSYRHSELLAASAFAVLALVAATSTQIEEQPTTRPPMATPYSETFGAPGPSVFDGPAPDTFGAAGPSVFDGPAPDTFGATGPSTFGTPSQSTYLSPLLEPNGDDLQGDSGTMSGATTSDRSMSSGAGFRTESAPATSSAPTPAVPLTKSANPTGSAPRR